MNNIKLNFYKKVLQEVCKKFDGAKELLEIKLKRFVVMKNSVEEVTYLIRNDYYNFKSWNYFCLLKSYKHHFECIVTTLIFFYNSSID